MRRAAAVAVKEVLQTARDPLTLGMLLGLPTALLLLFGYALSFDVRNARLAVQDRDMSAESRRLISTFENTGHFRLVATPLSEGDTEGLLLRAEARALLVIPERFGTDLAAGREARVQFLLDGSDSNTATTLLAYARGAAGAYSAAKRAAWTARSGRPPSVGLDYQPRVWYNPRLESTPFLVPGLIAFILMITGVMATALSVVRERERGTMDQLRITPLRGVELVAGKTLPYLVISLAATAFFLAAARYLFHVPVRGSLAALFVASLLYLLGALGFGLLISTVARSQALAYQIAVVTSLLPTIFLSGFIFPIRSAPRPVQWISTLVPARYFIKILRGVVLKGAGLGAYADQVGFLAAYAGVVMLVATVRMVRKRA